MVCNDILSDYKKIKTLAKTYFSLSKYDESLTKIEQAASIGYTFNLTDDYGDDELEDIILKIAKKTNTTLHVKEPFINKNIIFYDYFAWDNRGLTQQYLSSLEELGYNILFISRFELNPEVSRDIISQIKKNKRIKLITPPSNSTHIEAANFIRTHINNFSASKVFLHLSPWDITAFLCFSEKVENQTRYFINLTDHTYWLGKKTIDYCLEFRNYGYQLSTKYRNIASEKCKILPYYPIIKKNTELFQGLPKGLGKKIIGITGGSAYKYLDTSNSFIHLISPILKKHKNFVLLIVGATSAKKHFQKLSENLSIDKQIFYLPDREDISLLIQNSDIYIGSYPLAGGLMTQIAAVTGKPILSFNTQGYEFNEIEDLIPFRDKAFKTFYKKQDFLETADKLISDKSYRDKFAEYTTKKVMSCENFILNLKKILEGENIEIIEIRNLEINRINLQNKLIESHKNYSFSTYISINDLKYLSMKDKVKVTSLKLFKKLKHYLS